MAIFYKFASSKDYNSIHCDDSYISVYLLKRKIIELNYKAKKKADSNGLCLGTDFDLRVINAQTNVEYTDDSMLIPNKTSVLIRRVPGTRRQKHMPVDTSTIKILEKQQPNSVSNKRTGSVSVSSGASTLTSSGSSANNSVSISLKSSSSSGIDDSNASKSVSCTTHSGSDCGVPTARDHANFGSRLIKCDDGFCPIPGLPPGKKLYELDDEDLKIQLLVNTPSLPGWSIGNGSVGGSRVVGRMGGYGFSGKILEKKTPPAGYVCRRCGVSGHFIQHCPTNGNPDYDFRCPKPRASIFKSMPIPNPDDKEIECPSSKRSRISSDVPEELLCPLCKQVMRCAVLTSRCCLNSFCDKCIRDHLLMSKLNCVCGETGMLTDYLIPNITVREMIDRFLENGGSDYTIHSSSHETANNGSVENVKSAESSEEVQQKKVSGGMEKKRKSHFLKC